MGDRLGIHSAVDLFFIREWRNPALRQLESIFDWTCPSLLCALVICTQFLRRKIIPTPGVEPGPSG